MSNSALLLSYDKFGGIMFGQLGGDAPIFKQLSNNCSCIELLFSEALIASITTNVPFSTSKSTLQQRILAVDYIHGDADIVVVKSIIRHEVQCFYKTVGAWLHRLLLFAMRNFAYEEELIGYNVTQLLGLPVAITTDVSDECFDDTETLDISSVNMSECNMVDLMDTRHNEEFIRAYRAGTLASTAIGRLLACEKCLSNVKLGRRVERFCYE